MSDLFFLWACATVPFFVFADGKENRRLAGFFCGATIFFGAMGLMLWA